MSTEFHPDTEGPSENWNKAVVRYLRGFATHDQANRNDNLTLVKYADTSLVHRSMKQTPFELDHGYVPPLPLHFIADIHQLQANESAKTLPGREFVEQLQRILGVARDALCNAQDKPTAEPNKSRGPIDPASTAGAEVSLYTEVLPIAYSNLNPTRHKVVHHHIGTYKILRIYGNAVELDLPPYMSIYNSVNISRLKVDRTDDSRVAWRPPPLLVWTSHVGTCYVIESIADLQHSSEGTG